MTSEKPPFPPSNEPHQTPTGDNEAGLGLFGAKKGPVAKQPITIKRSVSTKPQSVPAAPSLAPPPAADPEIERAVDAWKTISINTNPKHIPAIRKRYEAASETLPDMLRPEPINTHSFDAALKITQLPEGQLDLLEHAQPQQSAFNEANQALHDFMRQFLGSNPNHGQIIQFHNAKEGDITQLPARLRLLASHYDPESDIHKAAMHAADACEHEAIQALGHEVNRQHMPEWFGQEDVYRHAFDTRPRMKRAEEALNTILGQIPDVTQDGNNLPPFLQKHFGDGKLITVHSHGDYTHYALNPRQKESVLLSLADQLFEHEKKLYAALRPPTTSGASITAPQPLSITPGVSGGAGGWRPIDMPEPHQCSPSCNHGGISAGGHYAASEKTLMQELHTITPAKKWRAAAGVGALAGGAFLLDRYGAADKSAMQKERRKTPEQRAEDIAYTINHSLYCTLTDFINPPINAATDGYLQWLIPGCGHDHSKDHIHGPHCDHPHHHHAPDANLSRWERVKLASSHAFSKERFMQYAKGEFIGDFGAVPITIAAQRYLPNLMHGIRRLCEPVIKPFFRYGIEADSKRWAKKNHVTPGSDAYNEHVAKVYEHEISHFPQAVVWTGASLALNVAYQMHADKTLQAPFTQKLALKTTSVLSGILVTAGMVVAARALAPSKMHQFDQWTSERFILPATKAVGKVFGVDEAAVDRMKKREETLKESWEGRIELAAQKSLLSERSIS